MVTHTAPAETARKAVFGSSERRYFRAIMSISSSNGNFATLGDLTHLSVLLLSLSFAFLAVTRYSDPSDTLFDADWKKEGFCVTNKDVPFYNSHDLCFYVDSVLGVLLGIVCLLLRQQPGMEEANKLLLVNVPGILAHGLGHAGIGASYRDGTLEENDIRGLTPLESAEHLYQLSFLLVFWLGMTKACFASWKSIPGIVLLAVTITVFHSLAVPNAFGFTFVQTILLLLFSSDQMMQDRSSKGLEYFTYPLMMGLPLTLVGWMESMYCTSFVKDKLYGHLAYDAYIPISSLVWYIMIYAMRPVEQVSAKHKAQ